MASKSSRKRQAIEESVRVTEELNKAKAKRKEWGTVRCASEEGFNSEPTTNLGDVLWAAWTNKK